jgi:predicted metal-dependent phosphoesterase TrpH
LGRAAEAATDLVIDLHTHTDQSDGTSTPAELISQAVAAGLDALAITDHDTFAGYDQAVESARAAPLELICGIELSTRFHGSSVHLLGYFIQAPPDAEFRGWLDALQRSRHDRNVRLIERLRSLGVDITLDEVRAKGKSLTGRPHFARVLVEKGYVRNAQEAFTEFLDESAKGFVERHEAKLPDAIARIVRSRGIPSIAHPVRLARNDYARVDELVGEMHELGLRAIEVYHSDHKPADVAHYGALAQRYGLAVTGGSDFHGGNKPNIHLGKLEVPTRLLNELRSL